MERERRETHGFRRVLGDAGVWKRMSVPRTVSSGMARTASHAESVDGRSLGLVSAKLGMGVVAVVDEWGRSPAAFGSQSELGRVAPFGDCWELRPVVGGLVVAPYGGVVESVQTPLDAFAAVGWGGGLCDEERGPKSTGGRVGCCRGMTSPT